MVYFYGKRIGRGLKLRFLKENKCFIIYFFLVLQASFILLIQRKNTYFLITYRLMMISNKEGEEILECTKKILIFIFKLNENDYENIFAVN